MRQIAVGIISWLALFAVLPSVRADLVAINRETGDLAWHNFTGDFLDIAAYTLQSDSGSFAAENWLSITENYDADSGGVLDPDDSWFILGSAMTDLSEATLGTTIIHDRASLDLGAAWKPGSEEDVHFEYLDARLNELQLGNVLYYTPLAGDFDANGFVDQGDLNLVLLHWGDPADPAPAWWINDRPSGRIDQEELNRVLLNWGDAVTIPSLSDVLIPLSAASVPEPPTTTILLVALSGLWGAAIYRRFCLLGVR